MSEIEDVAAALAAVQADLPVAEALAEADRIDEILQQVAALARESRNPLLREARDELTHARDILRRTAGHWGAAGSHLDEYAADVLGIAPVLTPPTFAASAADVVPVAPVDRSTPPGWPDEPRGISTQKQARHVLGTREYAQRKDEKTGGASAFFDEEAARVLVRRTWQEGFPVAGKNHVREYDFGYPIGVSSRGSLQTRVRVHLDNKGRLHGHPCGPGRVRTCREFS
ncbi:hypothetical protein FHR81_002736 [Actinoalloteichus hoggarensis]|uniref:Bacterial toxin 50 domain-containing protein n=1 Tax=Actinoalloteichus hoggarensis TaxID=1470176 RepID=A0A221VXW2_9PSEU|nr:hypothetical protein [Actinoalloteichus hoggarensis]ASO18333.1 hypothetical protein AHOG_03375 [Actinoalloteichus hoggarensis]MBB5921696.1 hypothetical protein [Actinoalloteichus hoggarensis]